MSSLDPGSKVNTPKSSLPLPDDLSKVNSAKGHGHASPTKGGTKTSQDLGENSEWAGLREDEGKPSRLVTQALTHRQNTPHPIPSYSTCATPSHDTPSHDTPSHDTPFRHQPSHATPSHDISSSPAIYAILSEHELQQKNWQHWWLTEAQLQVTPSISPPIQYLPLTSLFSNRLQKKTTSRMTRAWTTRRKRTRTVMVALV